MKTILDIERYECRFAIGYECRFAIGEATRGRHLFCAEPVRDEDCPFCAKHAEIVYQGRLADAPRGGRRSGWNPDFRRGRVGMWHKEDKL